MTNNGRYNTVPYKNHSNKLTPAMMDDVCELYSAGWKVVWIANKYKIDRSSVLYYAKRYNLTHGTTKIKLDNKTFQKYKYKSKQEVDKKNSMPHSIHKTYKERQADVAKRALTSLHDTECSHKYWTKRCSICKAILESDTRVNKQETYSEIDSHNACHTIVCAYQFSNKLAKLNTRQQSALYWVYNIELKLLQVKNKSNLPDRYDTNTLVVSAFTTQELCKHIFKLKNLSDDELINIAKLITNPNALARMLINLKKK